MANWTYNVKRVRSIFKTANESFVIGFGSHKMPLVHVDRFNLLIPTVDVETKGKTNLVVVFERRGPDQGWILNAFMDGKRLRKDVRAKYGLENLSISKVMSLAKTVNPRISVNISED